MGYIRLVDSSIWIAFHRIKRLDILRQLPNICLSPQVLNELRAKKDGLAESVVDLQNDLSDRLEVDEKLGRDLQDVLQFGHGISRADAVQAVWAAHRRGTILYMRNGTAERVTASIGGDVRNHTRLVMDIVGLGILSEDEGERLRQSLDDEFGRSHRRRRGRR